VIGNTIHQVTAAGSRQEGIYILDGDVTCAIDANFIYGASPLIGISAASAVDGGYEYNVGDRNVKSGSMTLYGTNLPART
jgi:hypothetical protein